jgi:hypothetical protein
VVLALATGTAVAQTGLIAFVGLAAPHLVRSMVKVTHAWLVLLASLMGGVLLMGADLLARWVIAPQELPVGVLTAVLGGGYLLWLMHGARAKGACCDQVHAPELIAIQPTRWALASVKCPVLHDIHLPCWRGAGPASSAPTARASPRCWRWPGCCRTAARCAAGPRAGRLAPARARRQLAWLGQNEAAADDLTAYDVAMLGRLPHQGWLAPPSAADHAAVSRRCATRPGTGASARWASSRAASASACCWRAPWPCRRRCC